MKNLSHFLFGLVIAVATCAADSDSAKPALVEFWHVGDDGLSQKLADRVENAFKTSPDFILSSERKPGSLIVTIPTNVEWKRVGKRTQVLYRVEFASADNKIISNTTGSCWDDKLAKCAAQIVKAATIAARKVH